MQNVCQLVSHLVKLFARSKVYMTVRYHWKGNSFKFKNKSMDLDFCLPGNKKSKQMQMVKKLHFILSVINNLNPSVTHPSPDDCFHAFSHGRINVTTVS
ncbi:hypothetical protein SFRURICE_013112 [Spodoptera frugiperda]|nr:hypothetical protein SFRURICE_013112 [Spodoptera frugiperda]